MLKRFLFGIVVTALALAPPVIAQDKEKQEPKKDQTEATPDEQYKDLASQYAKTQQELTRLQAQLRQFPAKFWDIAEKNPKTPAAKNALSWLLQFGAADQNLVRKASERFLQDHIADKDVLRAISAIARLGGDQQAIYRRILKENPHKEVQGTAAYYLAQAIVGADLRTGKMSAEKEAAIIAELDSLIEQYGDVEFSGRKLGKLLEGQLFEMKYLQIGKTAPEVTGEDVDGVAFKLTDYRGKVVVIDFWGDW